MGCSSSKEENDRDSAGAGRDGKRQGEDAADEAASVIAGAGLTARVHLSLSCDALANLDVGSKSDPFVVVSMKSGGDSAWSEIGRTEVVANNLNPVFVTLVPATFRFEEVQLLRFVVYDVAGAFTTSDASKLTLPSQQEVQGSAECALASIMGAHGQTFTQPLSSPHLPHQRATLTVRAEQAKNSSDLVTFELGASGCSSGYKRVFFRISRTVEAGAPIPCFKSGVAHASGGSLYWPETKVGLPILSNGDPYRPLLVDLLGYKKSGAHVPLGSCQMSVDMMVSKAGSGVGFALDGGVGEIVVRTCKLTPQPSFFDFLSGGLELQFTVAIDYTASNGDPNVSSSLHYHDPSERSINQYAQAISSVGSILEYYDSDKRFPVLGFGGCPIPNAPAVHCFAVNGREDDAEVQGIEGILDVYRESLRHVQLSGPTLFAPVINQVASVAASQRTLDPENQTYSVLMLITDGVICDMANTMDALVAAADLPFSVIIVGVGTADFSMMEELDGDDIRIQNGQGKPASRDIVQFVPMREFSNKGFHALAREVLAEVPQQVTEYMAMNHISACRPRMRPPQPPSLNGQSSYRSGSAHAVPVHGQ